MRTHARWICVGRGSAGVHQPSCIDIVSMGAHRWGRVGGGGGSTRVVRVVGMALVAVVLYYSRVLSAPSTYYMFTTFTVLKFNAWLKLVAR